MKNLTTLLSSIIAIFGFGVALNAQCPAGQVNVTVDVTTDAWGYECYWEYTPTGNACGTGTLGQYGNLAEVGCATGGSQVATAGGYPNTSTTTETLGCLTEGTCFDLHYIDDWGDGGATFDVYVDGALMYTFVGAGAGGVFTFCAQGPVGNDSEITSVTPHQYAMVPGAHASSIALGADVTNSGLNTLTNVVVNAQVINNLTVQSSSTSTPIATMAAGATQAVSFTGYTPGSLGVHDFVFTSSQTETDDLPANNMGMFTVDVNDSIYARDNGVQVGALGIGAANENGRLGQTFTAVVNDVVTSATAQFTGPTDGDMTSFHVYAMAGGVPTTLLGSTGTYTFNANDAANGVTVTLGFATPVAVTAGSDFLIAVAENNANITLATNDYAVVPGTNFVTWDSNPNGAGVWSNSEDFGFNVQYILRANMGANAAIAEQAFNVGAYPNPTSNTVTLDVPSELIGNVYTMFDQSGRLVAQGTLDAASTVVDMTSFDNGMYIVKIDAGNVTLSVVKQ